MADEHAARDESLIESLLEEGLFLFGADRTRAAIEVWRKVLEISPQEPRATDYLRSAGVEPADLAPATNRVARGTLPMGAEQPRADTAPVFGGGVDGVAEVSGQFEIPTWPSQSGDPESPSGVLEPSQVPAASQIPFASRPQITSHPRLLSHAPAPSSQVSDASHPPDASYAYSPVVPSFGEASLDSIKPGRRFIWIGLAAGLVLAIALAYVTRGGGAKPVVAEHGPQPVPAAQVESERPVAAVTDETPSLSPTPAAVGSPMPADEFFRFELRVEPPHARIRVDGLVSGTGALFKRFPIDGQVHEVVVSAPGYETQRLTFVDTAPPDHLVLARKASPADVSRATVRKRRRPHRRHRENAPPRPPASAPPAAEAKPAPTRPTDIRDPWE